MQCILNNHKGKLHTWWLLTVLLMPDGTFYVYSGKKTTLGIYILSWGSSLGCSYAVNEQFTNAHSIRSSGRFADSLLKIHGNFPTQLHFCKSSSRHVLVSLLHSETSDIITTVQHRKAGQDQFLLLLPLRVEIRIRNKAQPGLVEANSYSSFWNREDGTSSPSLVSANCASNIYKPANSAFLECLNLMWNTTLRDTPRSKARMMQNLYNA